MAVEVWSIEHREKWEEALLSFPADHVDVYDFPSYYATWADHEEAEPICLSVAVEGVRVLYLFFKKRIGDYDLDGEWFDVFSPYGYGGPVASAPEISTAAVKAVNQAIDDWIVDNNVVAEFIRCSPYRPQSRLRNVDFAQVRTNVEVELRDREYCWGNLNSSARRNVRRARSRGVVVEVDPALTSIEAFMEIYAKTYERLGMDDYYDFQPEYFLRTRASLKGQAFILNAKLGDSIIASYLCLWHNDKVHYHLGCSLPEFLSDRPNDLLSWAMIEEGLCRGLTTLELGGGTSADGDDPLFRFKQKFGNHLLPVYIGTRVHRQGVYDSICEQWEARYPELVGSRGDLFLRYRYAN